MKLHSTARRGLTLLELLIVLVLLALASAIVVPAMGLSHAAPDESVRLLTRSRQLAISRAERLRLEVQPTGSWSVRSAHSNDLVDSGRVKPNNLLASGSTQRWEFDALGDCLPDAQSGARAPFDALTCREMVPPALSRGGAP